MANSAYEIPFNPDFSSGAANLLTALKSKRADRNAEEMLKINREKLKNDERRLSAEEYRRQRDFEQGQDDRRNKAFLSALEFEKKGDHSTAEAIRRMHGIETTPEMSAPTLFTPAMALAAANKPEPIGPPTGNPVAFEQSPVSASPVTPMNAFGRPGEHTGVTVPEEQGGGFHGLLPRPELPPSGYQGGGVDAFDDKMRQQVAENAANAGAGLHGPQAQAPTDLTVEPPAVVTGGHAAEDLMPMTEEGHPTGAYTFTRPKREDALNLAGGGREVVGRYDPSEERKFREERAGRVGEALGPLGEQYVRIAGLIARGDIPEAEGKVLITTLAAEASAKNKAEAKVKAAEEDHKFRALMKKLYSNEPLTVQDRKDIAAMYNRGKAEATGAGPITPAEAAVVAGREAGDTLGQAVTNASEKGKDINAKRLIPLLGGVTRDAGTASRVQDKREALIVNGIDGRPLGPAHNVTQANALTKFTQQYGQARVRLEELIHDIETNGPRIAKMNPSELVDAIQQRLSEAESVNASMRVFNGLGATDASQKLEARITSAIGVPGHGWLMGANLNVIKRILHEADQRWDTAVKTTLRSGGGPPVPAALGGPRTDGGGGGNAPGVHWIPIPVRLRSDPAYAGKREVSVDASGNVTGSR